MENQAEMPRRLGIIAGGGVLPAKVATAAQAAGRAVFMLGIEGFADPGVLAPWPHEFQRLGAASRIIAALRTCGPTPRVPSCWRGLAAPSSPAMTDCWPRSCGC